MTCVVWIMLAGLMPSAAGESAATSSAPTTETSATTPMARARKLAMTGRYDDALSSFDRIAADDPGNRLAAAVGAAGVLAVTGRYEEALKRLRSVDQAGREDAAWHMARGRVLETLGRYDEAMEACRAVLGIDANHIEARYRCGRLYEIKGQPGRAVRLYTFFDKLARQRVPERADELVWHGLGFYRYSVLERHPNLPERTRYVLHELFQPAYEVKDPQYWPARIASAEFLLSKYNLADAAEDFAAALKINRNLPVAHAGLAAVALERHTLEKCEEHLSRALKINPRHVPARNTLVRLRFTERKYRQAAAEADRALKTNPNDLEALSLAAAAHIRLGDEKAAAEYERRVEKINPRCTLLDYTVAEWLAAARQFPEAERRYLQAIEHDASWADPRTALGLMYMQWGREAQARKTLDAAWRLDRFNRKTYNVLHLLEQIEKFQRVESDNFIVKLDANADAVLTPYFLQYLESIWPQLCRDYDHTPDEKTIVEVFPSHRAFSVRITSRPWIHTIGASTGRVIAMDAPRTGASVNGPFDWARVLRHELTHTITLSATRNRIPHWFTEALAVRQENAPRPFRWMLLLSRALRTGQLFTLEDIDWGFIRPRRANAREQAYAQSEWMADYIVAEHGYETIGKMLRLFRDGKIQADVIRAACGVSPDKFDKRFRKWAAEHVRIWGLPADPIAPIEQLNAAVKERPNDAAAHAALAEALLYNGKLKNADKSAKRALDIDRHSVLALTVRCTVLMTTWQATQSRYDRGKLSDEARPLLHRLAKLDAKSLVAPRYLAQLAMDGEDLDAAKPWLERLRRVSPHDPVGYRGFAALHVKQGETAEALGELTTLAANNEHDPELPLKIADLCAKLGREAETARWLFRTVQIDPYDPEIHEQLASLSIRLGRLEDAIREYRALCELQPTKADHFARLAVQCKKAGRDDEAREAARRAVELDPDSPVQQLLMP